jgi:hypothetical protein
VPRSCWSWLSLELMPQYKNTAAMLLYFSYTTYHTPSNTKSFEQHFCVRNNSGNMVVYTYTLAYWPTALLLMSRHHRRCGSGATLLRFLLGVTHGPPFFSSFYFVLFSFLLQWENRPLVCAALLAPGI